MLARSRGSRRSAPGWTLRHDRGMSLSKGDRVSWNTEQGRTRGEVVERRTRTFQLAGQKFTASDDKPMYVVRSEKTGAKAAHKESALRKLKG